MDWLRKPQFRLRSLSVLFAALVITALGAGAVQAQVDSSRQNSDRVSINIFDTELKSVVQLLMRETKKNIMIADQGKMRNKVSLVMQDMPFETVLGYVAKAAGCDMKKDENGVYIIGSKLDASVSVQQNVAATTASSDPNRMSRTMDDEIYVAKRSTKVEKIDLINTSPADMMWILGLYQMKDYPKIQKSRFKPGVFQQKANGDLDPIWVPGGATPNMSDTGASDGNTANRTATPDEEAAQFGGGGGGFGGGGGGNRGGGGFGGGGGGIGGGGGNRGGGGIGGGGGGIGGGGIGGGAGGIGGGGGTGGQSLKPDGIEYIMPYELDNSLIVKGDETGIDDLKAIISKLDIAPRQIMIKAEFVEITTTAAKALGINWQLERLSGSLATNFNTPGNITVGYANGNVMATLVAQLSNNKGKLINAPIISTMNNVPASIQVGTTIPYLTSQTIFNANGNPSTVTTPSFMNITSELLVLPRINSADNSITVYLEPTISDSPGSIDTPNGKIPIQSQQALTTTRRVQNGETIVIGGIIRKSESVNTTGIPLLMDLPLIGQLFRSTSKDINDKELLIFLTPSIVPEKPIAGGGIGVTP